MTIPKLPTRRELKWAAVDLDGTLAEGIWTPDNPTSEIGDPLWDNVEKLNDLVYEGFSIVIHTARGWTDYESIEHWLDYWQIPWRRIVCGKVLAAIYIDDRGRHAEEKSWIP